jgi:hypothetical protein
LELDERPYMYDCVFNAVYMGDRGAWLKVNRWVTPSEYQTLRSFRRWLLRVERQEKSAVGSIHTIHNLNRGWTKVFVACNG